MLLREAEAAAAQTGSAMEQASFLAPLLQGVLLYGQFWRCMLHVRCEGDD